MRDFDPGTRTFSSESPLPTAQPSARLPEHGVRQADDADRVLNALRTGRIDVGILTALHRNLAPDPRLGDALLDALSDLPAKHLVAASHGLAVHLNLDSAQRDGDASQRYVLLRALAMKPSSAQHHLGALREIALTDSDRELRRRARLLRGQSQLGEDLDVARLLELLRAEDPDVRLAAADRLHRERITEKSALDAMRLARREESDLEVQLVIDAALIAAWRSKERDDSRRHRAREDR